MQREGKDNLVIVLLILITISVLFLHRYFLNKSLLIDVNSSFPEYIITDSSQNGASVAKLFEFDDHYLFECDIIASDYPWPFCELSFSFGLDATHTVANTIDLTQFTSVKVSAYYLNQRQPLSGFRLHLRSFNPHYSSINDEASWKYSGIEYWPTVAQRHITIPLSALQVPTWWLVEKQLPIDMIAPELDNVVELEFATGNNIKPGKYLIRIESIEFIGKRFSDTAVYRSLIIMWLLAACTGVCVNIFRAKAKLANALQRAYELKQLNQLLNDEAAALKTQVERDALTGALNRHGIGKVLANDMPLVSIIMFDIDHFKIINDTHGHNAGDEVLQLIVRVISEHIRTSDFLCRWGGEEFLLLCPNTRLADAYQLAQSLRELIEDHRWPYAIKVTSSFGVGEKGKESYKELIERTDKALYQAKATGRNRVNISPASQNN
ncbi:GGDEF domain-containing protein [Shewanella waksmanii]|uniref:GGDEF domain-containing protein n=1 Tax=Shewanella waksmanii TaxID=213783 RepID=UPI003735E6D7